ncbi:DNA repair protein RadA [Hyphomicrobiales bacterium]|nr:DNA repair protein RadA [Hyphomicrobiales bacterium]
MSTAKPIYICDQCNEINIKWSGKCESCGSWNSLSLQENNIAQLSKNKNFKNSNPITLHKLNDTEKKISRLKTKNNEFDRVIGGGFVGGSALLVGGDPGIGKSTLLLQISAQCSSNDLRVLYVSGEEGIDQIRLRGSRLNIQNSSMDLVTSTSIFDIIKILSTQPKPDLVIIDSIQTMRDENIDSSPGTVSQVRSSTQTLINFAKANMITLILVGHVTKEGTIAGPRVIEHMVDCVLYFEGEKNHPYRILRSVKNRFGPTDEIGVFEMTSLGLQTVENPSSLFINKEDIDLSGTSFFAGIEGTRPLLTQIQSLVVKSSLGTPRRAVVGVDSGRLSLIIAVLEARCNISFSSHDIYINVAGGLKVTEPAADLAIAAALLSSFYDIALDSNKVYFGEISLSGSLRPANRSNIRLKEAIKLGFKKADTSNNNDTTKEFNDKMEIYILKSITELNKRIREEK